MFAAHPFSDSNFRSFSPKTDHSINSYKQQNQKVNLRYLNLKISIWSNDINYDLPFDADIQKFTAPSFLSLGYFRNFTNENTTEI